MGEEWLGDYENLIFQSELKEMEWLDFIIPHQCDLVALYDKIVEMLDYHIFKIGGSHDISEFFDLCLN